jgi:hypothetical protein
VDRGSHPYSGRPVHWPGPRLLSIAELNALSFGARQDWQTVPSWPGMMRDDC